MGFINAIKITFSRISLVFKVLLYDIIVAGIMIAICAGVLLPQFSEVGTEIGKLAIGEGIIADINIWLDGGIKLSDVFAGFYQDVAKAIEMVGTNLWSLAFATIIVAVLVTKFLIGLRTIPTYDIVNSYMTESSNYYFLGNLTHNIGRSAKFSGLQMLFSLPCDVLILVILYFGIGLLFDVVGIFALPLIVILIVCLFAFKNTIFYFWIPSVVQGKPMVKAFSESVKLAFKHFSDIFLSQITYLLFVVVLGMIAIITTFGAGLLVVGPLLFVILIAMKLAKYYDVNKMRYYVTVDKVVTPSIVEEIEVSDTTEDYEATAEEDKEA